MENSAGDAPAAAAPAAKPVAKGVDIIQVLTTAVSKGGSDVVFTVGSKPRIRIGGKLRTYGDEVLTPDVTKKMLYSLLTDDQKAHFEETLEIDLSVNIRNVGRFRLNGFRQRGHVAAVLRSIPTKLPTCQQLNLPQAITDIADYPRGLVLITGPTGSGKSTLLAALLAKINAERECHIITIEDPIEFVHPHMKAVVEQREVGSDTRSFANALKYILRQNPDVILVGEMRDPETISAAITLAETGHLVFSTLHTQNCAQTMDRIIDSFPHEAQNQIRSQLALTLRAVVSQCLIPVPDGTRCQAAREIMVVTPAISALIREGKGHMIGNSIQTGRAQGMITMEACIQELLEQGLVDEKQASLKINAMKQYSPTGSKIPGGGLTAGGTEAKKPEKPPEPVSDKPLDVDDVPVVSSNTPAPPPKPTEKKVEGPPPNLEMPNQLPVIALAVLGLAAGGFATFKNGGPKSPPPFNPMIGWALGGLMIAVFIARYVMAKRRIQSELRRMLDEG